MPISSSNLKKIKSLLISLSIVIVLLSVACSSRDPLPPPCIEAKPDIGETPHWGKYDYISCNIEGCHTDYVGGWIYNNPEADEIVQGATVTVTNSDGTTVEGVTRSDGFFLLIGDPTLHGNIIPSADARVQHSIIIPPYKPCVSKCPGIECAKKPHTSTDCQSSNCHGAADSQLYVPLERTSVSPCANLPEAGPRVHDAFSFDGVPCRNCHPRSYIGGYVYDGLTSDTAVDRAEVTLTSTTGYKISAVSGPEGMFHFKNGIFAPYIACVSKCGVTVCSLPESHPTADDCCDCHNEANRIHVP